MAESQGDLDLTTVEHGGCFAQWRAGLPCEGEWSGVIENLKQAGYGQFCAVHMQGYRDFNRGAEGIAWKAWTRAGWIESGRAAEHGAAIASGSALLSLEGR